MTQFKRICLVLAVCALIIPAAAKDKKPVESCPVAVPVVIDGNATEWPADSLLLEKDVNVGYAFQNDAAFLYILFQFNEAKYMSSVEASGLTLWVNNDGKERKNHGLHFYRKSVTGPQLIKILESEGQTLTEDKKKEFLSRPSYSIWACDVINKKGEVVPHPGVAGGTFRTSKTQKTSVYELVVPIALLADPNADKKWDPSKLLKIGFEWGGLTDAMRKNEAANLSDQRARASASGTELSSQIAGDRESRDYGGGGDFDGAQMRALASKYKKLDFWLDLKVFQNK